MKTLVSTHNLDRIVRELFSTKHLGLDTETTGLREKDRLFSLIIADELDEYYLDFTEQLPKTALKKLSPLWQDPTKIWYIANAKFDMHMLRKEGIRLYGQVICIKTVERLLKNDYPSNASYKLENMAKRRGWAKDDAVKKYVDQNNLYTKHNLLGKEFREAHFDRVPKNIMFEYATHDARLHYDIGKDQTKRLYEIAQTNKKFLNHYRNEVKLTKICYDMESKGILMDKQYIHKAIEHEKHQLERLRKNFHLITGENFLDSRVLFKRVFDAFKLPYKKTEKGNASFSKDALKYIDHPIVNMIRDIRTHEKYLSTYYINFLYFMDDKNILRPSMNQAGTKTGRFSYSQPNCQNIPKEDEGEYTYYVRKSFIPRKGHTFFCIDYDQMEYRVMLDYAGERGIIKKINDGEDVHQATADLLGISRKHAKTVNFACLYGTGIETLSQMLGVKYTEARQIRQSYFAKLPKVKKLIDDVQAVAKSRGYVTNWFGRRLRLFDPEHSYIMPNHLIQGSCADIMKKAMVNIKEELGVYALINVHDELVFEFKPVLYDIVPKIVHEMEKVYTPHARNGVRLTCGVSHSDISWGYCDLSDGGK